ncbi:MAG: GGDEF domain-containing protein [Piscinibacter sp.]|nr:GGDEF domain-containing protein [Piscinibacter sp.]
MPSFSATEIAFLMVACQQAVLAFGWLAGAALMVESRRAALHWALYAALSAVSLVLFVVSVKPGIEPLRALANLCIVVRWWCCSVACGPSLPAPDPGYGMPPCLPPPAPPPWYGLDPANGAWRVAVVSGALSALCLSVGWDMQREARARMELRWGAVLSVPLLLGGLVFGLRAGRAMVSPGTIVAEVTADSALNVSAAFSYLVLALVFQLTLVALVVTRGVVELRRASRYDALTGLLNRRAAQEALEDELQRSRRLGEPFSVLMIDADHFKSINDLHGHAVGDRALQHLGTLLSAQMRDIDRVGRWGGEEFIVLLPGTPLAQAQEVAERLRERTQALPPRWQERAVPLTVSLGVSQWAGPSDELSALMARADAAMYRAKANGRNRVEVEPPPGAPRVSVVR